MSRPRRSWTLGPRSTSTSLYVEYLGQGDSDEPRGHAYSTIERADRVEALWAAHEVTSTVAVSFDYSSLVVLELLARRLDRRAAGEPEGTRITGCQDAGRRGGGRQ
jgi:pimeloyl-ACP methyl ester carboxylesterase